MSLKDILHDKGVCFMPAGLFQTFIPWILYFILAGSNYVADETAAIAAFVAAIIFTWQALRKKFILEWATVIYFAFLSVMYLSPLRDWLIHYAYLLSNIVLSLIMWGTIIIKRPFTMQYAREETEEILWETPLFKQINYSISVVWAMALSIMAIGNILQISHIIASNKIADIIQVASLIIAIWFTKVFPDWYQGFLFRKLSKKTQDHSTNPFLSGNYAPIKDELSVTHLPIVGKLPSDMQGIYMRNGPNSAFPPISYTYPLDGDGMLHAIYLSDGNASYRNRFVETKGLLAEKRAGRALYGGIMNPIPTDPKLIGKDGDPGPIKNGAFIHIIRHAEQYLALRESSPGYQVSAQLQTIGEWCPRGGKSPFLLNAHTRFDPATGELFVFTYDFQQPYLSYSVLDAKGKLVKTVPIDKPHPSMMHDFALTKNYVLFFDCPAVFDMKALSTGTDLLQWRPELGVRIGVVNRLDNTIFWIETESFFVYHFVNAYEQNNKIFVDYVKHERLSLAKEIKSKEMIPPVLFRTIIDLVTKSAIHQQLDDHYVEFPRINDGLNTQSNRYIYILTKSNKNSEFNALIKYDAQQQKTIVHDFGKTAEISEAVFAPSSTMKGEDDGYMMLFVYDKNEDKSKFVLLDASNFTDEPIASIQLPRRVPHGLHGSWMPGQW